MSTELDALRAQLHQLQTRIETSEQRYANAQRRLRIQACLAFCVFLAALFLSPGRAVMAQVYGVTLVTLNTRLLAVEAKTQFQSADATAKSTTFSGCNVVVNGGGGSTSNIITNAAGQGIGNLIIGYNGLRGSNNIRAGSHNLILGDQNNYSSYGGLVGGFSNTISGIYASVSAGQFSTASGQFASLSGGNYNTASGLLASVSGGYSNAASGQSASISGGEANIASNVGASVSGGVYITASGQDSSISGGINLTQNNYAGWSGGTYQSP